MGQQISDRYNPSRQLKVNEDGSIDTNLLSGDIEIGAVELKNATDDTRAVIKSDGVDNALVVSQNSQPLPIGAATSSNQITTHDLLNLIKSNQETMNELLNSLRDMNNYLATIASAKGIAADLRVTNLNTPNMTTLGNITLIGGLTASDIVSDVQNISAQSGNVDNVG